MLCLRIESPKGHKMTDSSLLVCGYIKAKFALVDGKELWEHPAYVWAAKVTRPRVTSNFIYLTLGPVSYTHLTLPTTPYV